MNAFPLLNNIVQAIFGVAQLSDRNRPIRLVLPEDQEQLQQGMLIQHISGTESLCGGIDLDIICLTTSALIPTKALLAMPLGVQLVTDRGELHQINGLVTAAGIGQSDGSLTVVRLRVQDAFELFKQRRNSRVFLNKNIIQISDVFFDEWKKNSPLFSSVMSLDTSGVKQDYPTLPFTYQHDETDQIFLERHWKKHGLSWYLRPAKSGLGNVLCLFDDAMSLEQNHAGTVRYHRHDATETRDSITSWTNARSMTSGSTSIQQWQPQSAVIESHNQMAKQADSTGRLGSLASMLEDAQIITPSTNLADNALDRFGMLQMLRHEMAAKYFTGESSVRDLRVGQWISVSEHPELDQHDDHERQFVITELHYESQNNLPKGIQAQVEKLIGNSQWSSANAFAESDANRYRNTFTAIRRGIPLVPAYDPKVDRPHAFPQVATVVTPEGEEVHCDDWGRVKIRFNGLREIDHTHAGGSGASDTDSDSAWVEVITPWAGSGFGSVTLPRKNESVIVEFIGGDPDRPVIMGRTFHGQRNPPKFSNTGSLPNNRYMSGIVSQEIKGSQKNQLRLDDTPQQISAQLSSDHGASQLNLGFLTHPRDWTAEKRGEGFELRSDEHGAIRAAKGLFISTDAQTNAKGKQLDIEAAIQQLEQALADVKLLQKSASTCHADPATNYTRYPSLQQQLDDQLTSLAKPNILISTPAGIAVTTPKSHTYNAGESITMLAHKQIDLNSMGQITLTSNHGVSLFTQEGGIKAIANQGEVQIQSQNDAMQVAALKDVSITSSQGKVTIAAKTELVMACGNGYIKIKSDGSIEIGSPAVVEVKSQAFNRLGAASLAIPLPNISASTKSFSHQFKAENPYTKEPTVDVPYFIDIEGQAPIYGKTDDQGLTKRIYTEAAQKVNQYWGTEALLKQLKIKHSEES
jgi:type VI secretion system secreted protein VgrG